MLGEGDLGGSEVAPKSGWVWGKSGWLHCGTVSAHLRQRGMRAPDSWLNFRCTLSSCRVRMSSWGIMVVELSLSRLSLRLLQSKHGNRFSTW